MAEADQLAGDLGLSRSGLIADALRDYLKKRRQMRITDQLNQAYATGPTDAERRLVQNLKAKLPLPDKW